MTNSIGCSNCTCCEGDKRGSSGKTHAQLDKYARKIHDSYEKQIRKVELSYASIFQALETHKLLQIDKLRNLQAA